MENNNIVIDWNKFKSKAKGKSLEKSKNGYIELCKLIHSRGHELLSEYRGYSEKIQIDYGYETKWTTPYNYKIEKRIMETEQKEGVEIIDGIPIDWDKFEGNSKGIHLDKAKDKYIELCTEIHKNGHSLESKYSSTSAKILVDLKCGHRPIQTSYIQYMKGYTCKECKPKKEKLKEYINTCEICGKEFVAKNKSTRFCSKECRSVHKKKENCILKNCEICGKEFTANQSNHKICSDECRELKYLIGRCSKVFYYKCKVCANDFTSNNSSSKTCSDICKDIYSKSSYEKQKEKASKSNKTMNKDNYNDIVIFTVKELINKGIEGRDNNGISFNDSRVGFTSTLKDEVRDRDDWTCRTCGCKTRLEVHHIVKVRHNGTNELDNLITLCTSCHRAIDTLDLDHALKVCNKNAEKNLKIEKHKDTRTNKEIIEDSAFDLRAIYSILNRQADDPDIADALMILGRTLDTFEGIE